MAGGELGVEQAVAARNQPGDQMGEAHFGGVALAGEHAFAEEGAANAHPVEPAHQLALAPGLHRVAVAKLEEFAVEAADFRVDPGVVPARCRLGAAVDDAFKITVHADLEMVRAHGAGKAAGQVEAVEGQDAAVFRLDPEQMRVIR